jgi:hypothetical protein
MDIITMIKLDRNECRQIDRSVYALAGLADDWVGEEEDTVWSALHRVITGGPLHSTHFERALDAALAIRAQVTKQTTHEFWSEWPHAEGFVEMRQRDLQRLDEGIALLISAVSATSPTIASDHE